MESRIIGALLSRTLNSWGSSDLAADSLPDLPGRVPLAQLPELLRLLRPAALRVYPEALVLHHLPDLLQAAAHSSSVHISEVTV